MKENNTSLTQMDSYTWAFFGTSIFSVYILDQMKAYGFLPALIITSPDKPKGRKLILTPTPVKIWAQENNIPWIEPSTLKDIHSIEKIRSYAMNFDVFVVASYGKILPQDILTIPQRGILNVHPSLLPRLRGASPIQSSILQEDETGVSIMHIDAEMDHGPIIVQEKVHISHWPPYAKDLENILGNHGGKLLAQVFIPWITESIIETPQDHTKATYCNKIQKIDGELNLDDSPHINLRKIRAYQDWPTAYFFEIKNNIKIRIIVTQAHIENDMLIIDKVIPEGKKEMDYSVFRRK